MIRGLVSEIIAAARDRPAGYLDECLARGHVIGEFIEFDEKTYAELRGKYNPRGMGDALAWLTRRFGVARAVEEFEKLSGIPCGCEDRIAWLNERFPS